MFRLFREPSSGGVTQLYVYTIERTHRRVSKQMQLSDTPCIYIGFFK
jgi:hypothetical protein